MARIARIQSQDDGVNRLQDEIAKAVNPLLRRLEARPEVTGSTGGNVALASLMAALDAIGLITNKTGA
jgi:hypothetical protein